MQVHVASPGIGVGTPGRQFRPSGSPPSTQQVLHRSSPTAASVDSFSSYINRDAPGFNHRSSSPRLEDQIRDHSDPASQPSQTESPQPRLVVAHPVVSREAFRSSWSHEQHAVHHHVAQPQHVSLSHSPAIDVNRLSSSNLAQKDEQDRQHSLDHDHTHSTQPPYHSASLAADDSFETTASTMGDDSKGDVRRRRRTRPDEANLLVEAYLDNAFPDHGTRLALANQVGMSVRAVSVWFQNRRQAEKKRSGRYSGASIKHEEGTPLSVEVSENNTPFSQSVQRRPLGNAASNGVPGLTRPQMPIEDFSINNKENIPPGAVSRSDVQNPLQEHIAKLKRTSSFAKEAAHEPSPVAMPRSISRDLRTMVGPDGAGLDEYSASTGASENVPPPVASKSSVMRHRSTPRVSLDQVLGGRSDSLRRSQTEQAREPLKSSDIEEDDLDTILPPRKLLSRASSMSLLTTAGGRASLGNFVNPAAAAAASSAHADSDTRSSLNSRLPPVLTASLQKQGIIAVDAETEGHQHGETRQVLLEKMPDSSVSSSDFDMLHNQEDRPDCEEDEERTLKMIAQRRAAKAHAAQMLVHAQTKRPRDAEIGHEAASTTASAPAVEAREALNQARLGNSATAAQTHNATTTGMSKCPSLDWAASRDRARTTAIPHSVAGTPFSRSVSASHLSQREEMRAPDMTASLNGKRSSGPLRSVSATDLTKRLHEARKKGVSISAGRKRPAKAMHTINDENAAPSTSVQESLKRRKQPHEVEREGRTLSSISASGDLWLTEAGQMRAPRTDSSPLLSGRPLMPHPLYSSSEQLRTGVPSTPSAASLYTSGLPMPLSSRSDRYRAIGASPAGSLGRSISANYQIGRGLPQSRESSAREQQGRAWDAVRPDSAGPARTFSDDTWAAQTSFSQPLSMTASTPSRVLTADRSTLSSTPRNSSRDASGVASSPFLHEHDDSGFFGDGSSDEEDNDSQGFANKRGPLLPSSAGSISPRKASLRSNAKDAHFAVSRTTNREGDDHHAAQLLLGLGKSVGSREGSSQ